jgi:putative transposase
MYPLVTDLAAEGVPVAVTCRVLKFSKQGYYRWRASPLKDRDWVDAHLVNAALDIHADDPAFGYRFIADGLPEKGIKAGENRVQRLCKNHGIWSVFCAVKDVYSGRIVGYSMDSRMKSSLAVDAGHRRPAVPASGSGPASWRGIATTLRGPCLDGRCRFRAPGWRWIGSFPVRVRH